MAGADVDIRLQDRSVGLQFTKKREFPRSGFLIDADKESFLGKRADQGKIPACGLSVGMRFAPVAGRSQRESADLSRSGPVDRPGLDRFSVTGIPGGIRDLVQCEFEFILAVRKVIDPGHDDLSSVHGNVPAVESDRLSVSLQSQGVSFRHDCLGRLEHQAVRRGPDCAERLGKLEHLGTGQVDHPFTMVCLKTGFFAAPVAGAAGTDARFRVDLSKVDLQGVFAFLQQFGETAHGKPRVTVLDRRDGQAGRGYAVHDKPRTGQRIRIDRNGEQDFDLVALAVHQIVDAGNAPHGGNRGRHRPCQRLAVLAAVADRIGDAVRTDDQLVVAVLRGYFGEVSDDKGRVVHFCDRHIGVDEIVLEVALTVEFDVLQTEGVGVDRLVEGDGHGIRGGLHDLFRPRDRDHFKRILVPRRVGQRVFRRAGIFRIIEQVQAVFIFYADFVHVIAVCLPVIAGVEFHPVAGNAYKFVVAVARVEDAQIVPAFREVRRQRDRNLVRAEVPAAHGREHRVHVFDRAGGKIQRVRCVGVVFQVVDQEIRHRIVAALDAADELVDVRAFDQAHVLASGGGHVAHVAVEVRVAVVHLLEVHAVVRVMPLDVGLVPPLGHRTGVCRDRAEIHVHDAVVVLFAVHRGVRHRVVQQQSAGVVHDLGRQAGQREVPRVALAGVHHQHGDLRRNRRLDGVRERIVRVNVALHEVMQLERRRRIDRQRDRRHVDRDLAHQGIRVRERARELVVFRPVRRGVTAGHVQHGERPRAVVAESVLRQVAVLRNAESLGADVVVDFEEVAHILARAVQHGRLERDVGHLGRRLVRQRQRPLESLAAHHRRLLELHLHMGADALRLTALPGSRQYRGIAFRSAVCRRHQTL